MESVSEESLPFNSLRELYDNLNDLTSWPKITELRESTEYVYKGSEVNEYQLQLDRANRDEQPRTLVCHDMKHGYLEDRFINGSTSHDFYVFYHWSIVDIFVYFSHRFITIPPYGWINAAHTHGVKVFGTVITEHSDGEKIWEEILVSQETVEKFANALVSVAKFYKFEGWLLNVENKIKEEKIENLIYFVKYLTERIHREIDESEIIWYDSVTNKGELKWQNELNENNKDFFLNCDGIFLNYNWSETKLAGSHVLAKSLKRNGRDVYVGLDVWGRGCPGGGGFNSAYATEIIRGVGLSVGIFAPGWTHEKFGGKNFEELEDTFWAQLFPYMYVHVPIYENQAFRTSFCRGNGTSFYHYGEVQLEMIVKERGRESIFGKKSFYNLSLQKPQISVPVPYLKFTYSSIPLCNEIKEKDTKEKPQVAGDGDGSAIEKTGNENQKGDLPRKGMECIFENQRNIIKIIGNVVNLEDKSPTPDGNYFEFYRRFAYEGGGCLKLIIKRPDIYHRLFLVHIELEREIEASIIYKSSEIDSVPNDPALVLDNGTGLKSILSYESTNLDNGWRKCSYLTIFRTVREVGLVFSRRADYYLGEILLDRRRRDIDNCESTECANRISEYNVY